jgi:hypothetical protein
MGGTGEAETERVRIHVPKGLMLIAPYLRGTEANKVA